MQQLKDKKIMIVASLGLVFVGIGAFTVLRGDNSEPVASKKKHSKPAVSRSSRNAKGSYARIDRKSPSAVNSNDANGGVDARTTDHHSNEAAKSVPVETSAAPEAKNSEVASSKVDDSTKAATSNPGQPSGIQMSSSTAANSLVRDPFRVPIAGRPKSTGTGLDGSPAVASTDAGRMEQDPLKKATRKGLGHSIDVAKNVADEKSARNREAVPGGMDGELPPINPAGSSSGSPVSGSTAPKSVPGGPNVKPGKPLRLADEFSYTVAGVVEGARPCVIFEDDKGHQQLVRLGQSLGGGQVVAIRNGAVTVMHHGKQVTLRIGGGSEKP